MICLLYTSSLKSRAYQINQIMNQAENVKLDFNEVCKPQIDRQMASSGQLSQSTQGLATNQGQMTGQQFANNRGTVVSTVRSSTQQQGATQAFGGGWDSGRGRFNYSGSTAKLEIQHGGRAATHIVDLSRPHTRLYPALDGVNQLSIRVNSDGTVGEPRLQPLSKTRGGSLGGRVVSPTPFLVSNYGNGELGVGYESWSRRNEDIFYKLDLTLNEIVLSTQSPQYELVVIPINGQFSIDNVIGRRVGQLSP